MMLMLIVFNIKDSPELVGDIICGALSSRFSDRKFRK
jgi:hypothetical protein